MKAQKLIHIFKLTLLTVMSVVLFADCQQDNFFDKENDIYSGEPRMEFKVTISDEPIYVTKALTQTPVNVEPSEFDGYFYIQVNDPTFKNPNNPDTTPVNSSKFGYYKVPIAGNGGVLEYVGNPNDKPNWYTLDDDHYFWSWTLPWTEAAANDGVVVETWGDDTDENGFVVRSTRADNESEGKGDGEGEGDGDDVDKPLYVPVDPQIYLNTNPIRIKLKDTRAEEFRYVKTEEEQDSSWQAGSWGNGYFFEKFIGAKSGPYDFRRNGVEVPLQFRHLMSRISIRSLLFYRADGTTEEDLQANITFINMPTEFTFYPHPTENGTPGEDNQYMKKDGPPIVVTNQSSADPNGGIMYGFTNPIDLLPEEDPDNKVQYRDKFYICPEVDFSNVSFKVEIVGGSFMNRGEYYGDFSSIAFERDPEAGYDYDNIKDENGNVIDDTKVLHAGETMYFDLIVKEYGGGGYTIYVRNWSTRPRQQTKHYPHPGIYVDGEGVELIGSQPASTKFDLYGDGFWDGKEEPLTPSLPDHLGLYHQYNDLDMGNRTNFPLDKEYLLDGMGHILKFSPSSDTTTVTIGKMVDIYIEINGYTVYIDPEGYICTLDPKTGKYMPNGKQLDIHGEKNSFTLNVATGDLK